MLAPELIRIHEKPIANWVTPAKVDAIRGEFMRQCDSLDGLRRRRHQQLHGVPCASMSTRRARRPVGGEALSGRRRSECRRYDARMRA